MNTIWKSKKRQILWIAVAVVTYALAYVLFDLEHKNYMYSFSTVFLGLAIGELIYIVIQKAKIN